MLLREGPQIRSVKEERGAADFVCFIIWSAGVARAVGRWREIWVVAVSVISPRVRFTCAASTSTGASCYDGALFSYND